MRAPRLPWGDWRECLSNQSEHAGVARDGGLALRGDTQPDEEHRKSAKPDDDRQDEPQAQLQLRC